MILIGAVLWLAIFLLHGLFTLCILGIAVVAWRKLGARSVLATLATATTFALICAPVVAFLAFSDTGFELRVCTGEGVWGRVLPSPAGELREASPELAEA